VPGATELSPSRSQYFSWINNRNEGSTEAQTLANVEFFKWLHDEYGMQLDIYAFDAGNIDGPQYYGRTDTDKFKAQFPRGFAADGPVEVRQFHPCERILGTFKPGEEVAITVLPFRGCLLLVDAKRTCGVGLRGCDYEVVRDVPGKDIVVRVLGSAGGTSEVSLVSNGRAFRRATIDGQPMAELTTGKTVRIQFPGSD